MRLHVVLRYLGLGHPLGSAVDHALHDRIEIPNVSESSG